MVPTKSKLESDREKVSNKDTNTREAQMYTPCNLTELLTVQSKSWNLVADICVFFIAQLRLYLPE